MECTCPVCCKKHWRAASEAHHTCCSNECGQRLRFLNLCEKIGRENLIRMYQTECMSFREIERSTHISVKTLRKMAVHFGIEVRHGSDAVKLQWANNAARRRLARETFRRVRAGIAPWNKGLSKDTDERLRELSLRHSGSGNPCYKDGSTGDYNRLRSSPKHRRWANAVKERDGRKCKRCGSTGRLHAHHIKSFRRYPELRYEIKNGETLCHDCHWDKHRKLSA